ncbi:unnamed protein product [Urochloa humidicola]
MQLHFSIKSQKSSLDSSDCIEVSMNKHWISLTSLVGIKGLRTYNLTIASWDPGKLIAIIASAGLHGIIISAVTWVAVIALRNIGWTKCR